MAMTSATPIPTALHAQTGHTASPIITRTSRDFLEFLFICGAFDIKCGSPNCARSRLHHKTNKSIHLTAIDAAGNHGFNIAKEAPIKLRAVIVKMLTFLACDSNPSLDQLYSKNI